MLKSEYIQKWCKKNYMKSYYSLNSDRFGVKTSKMDLVNDDDYQTYLAYCKFNPRSKNPRPRKTRGSYAVVDRTPAPMKKVYETVTVEFN